MRRRSRMDPEKVRRETRAYLGKANENDPLPPKLKKLLSCGHDEYVHPGVDPETAVCWTCQLKQHPRH